MHAKDLWALKQELFLWKPSWSLCKNSIREKNLPKCAVKLILGMIVIKYWEWKLWKDSGLKLLCKNLHSCSKLNKQMLKIIYDALWVCFMEEKQRETNQKSLLKKVLTLHQKISIWIWKHMFWIKIKSLRCLYVWIYFLYFSKYYQLTDQQLPLTTLDKGECNVSICWLYT